MVLRSPKSVAAIAAVSLALAATACTNASSGDGAAPSGTEPRTATTYEGTDFTINRPVTAPGVTDSEIHVGSITSKTNPIGGDNGLLNDGINAYFDVVNSNGGVWGRQLKLTSERDDNTVSNLNETQAMLAQDNVYAVFEAVELFSGAKLLAKAGIPTFGWNINAEWAGPTELLPEHRARSASARRAARSARRCRGSCSRRAGTRSRSSATTSRSRRTR